jgi:hypothetical protein
MNRRGAMASVARTRHPIPRDSDFSCWCGRPRRHRMCQIEVVEDPQAKEPSASKIIRIGVDTSKGVFQLHGVDEIEMPVLRRKLRRHQGDMVTLTPGAPTAFR